MCARLAVSFETEETFLRGVLTYEEVVVIPKKRDADGLGIGPATIARRTAQFSLGDATGPRVVIGGGLIKLHGTTELAFTRGKGPYATEMFQGARLLCPNGVVAMLIDRRIASGHEIRAE